MNLLLFKIVDGEIVLQPFICIINTKLLQTVAINEWLEPIQVQNTYGIQRRGLYEKKLHTWKSFIT